MFTSRGATPRVEVVAMGRKSFAERRADKEAAAFIHAIDVERRSAPSRVMVAMQVERPLGEHRIAKATNLGWRHKRQHRPSWTWTLTNRQRFILRWAERYAPGQGRDVASTLCLSRWLYAFRREAQQRQGEADALDVALSMLRRGGKARMRRAQSRAQRVTTVVKLAPVVDLAPTFDAVAFGREYAMSHSIEALALYGKAE